MPVCGHTDASVGASGGTGSPGTRVTDFCEPPNLYTGNRTLGPLEQQVFLTSELYLQLLSIYPLRSLKKSKMFV